jgi:ATP-dependent Clp protease protease subunit
MADNPLVGAWPTFDKPDPKTVALEQEKLRAEISKIRTDEASVVVDQILTRAESDKVKAETRSAKSAATVAAISERKSILAESQELRLNKFNHVYVFDSQVSESSVKACIAQLTEWLRETPPKAKPMALEIIFDSPGGTIVDGLALFDYIQLVRATGHRVTTSALGMAASMAGVLLQAGDIRVMTESAWLLIHEGSLGAIGSVGEVEDTVEFGRRLRERIVAIYVKRSGKITKTSFKAKWKRKNWWLDAEESLKYGFIDEIRGKLPGGK